MQDRTTMTALEIKAEARARRIGPDGRPGATSWIVAANRERIVAALEAADSGEYLEPESAPSAGSVLDALIREALERPQGVDESAVRTIVREEMANGPAVTVSYVHRSGEVRYTGRQHPQFATMLAFVSAGDHVLLAGEKGSGKSEAARAAASALNIPFRADSFSLDSGRHDVFGFVDAQSRYVRTAFRECYENGGLYCADEIDNGTASLTAAFNLALSNGHCAFPDGACVPRHENFRFVATANTVNGATLEFSGRDALDGAFLDRLAVFVWNVDESFERDLALAHAESAADARGIPLDRRLVECWVSSVQQARTIAASAGLSRMTTSPRASIGGAVKLVEGVSWDTCAEALVLKCADADTRARLAPAMARAR